MIALIGLVLASFAILSYSAVSTKSSTFDEPLHAVAGATHWHLRDFRMDFDNPPLWLYWAEIPNWGRALPLDVFSTEWKTMAEQSLTKWKFAVDTIYHTPGTAGEAFIRRCRPMQLVLGVATGCVLAAFTWQVGGAVAALIAAMLFAFDPTVLGHSPLVKNDVPVTLVTIAFVWGLWHVGRRITIGSCLAIAPVSALTLTVKFSGILLVPIAAMLLVARAFMPFDWPVFGRFVNARSSRVGVAICVSIFMGMAAYVGVWASYGFRFSAIHDGPPLDTKNMLAEAALTRLLISNPNTSERQLRPRVDDELTDDMTTQFTDLALRHRLLPEAWLNGLLATNEWAKARDQFLCGERSLTGWRYYFPLAFLFKTPLGTLALAAAVGIGLCANPKKHWQLLRQLNAPSIWAAAVIAVPFGIYSIMAMMSHLNIGIRHILPIYPFIFMAIALGSAYLMKQTPRAGFVVCVVALLALMIETLAAWPNYIAFFNIACGGTRGGFHLLSDSNLDWGQDLSLVAKWQREHPDDKLYLAYPEPADPSAYGIRYALLPGSLLMAKPTESIDEPGYLAIGANILQKPDGNLYEELVKTEPVEVLGGTTYIYSAKNNPAALNVLGRLHLIDGRIEKAVAILRQAIELDPNNAESHKRLGEALVRLGLLPQAIEEFQKAIKLNKNDGETHNNLGVVLAMTGDTEQAIAALENAVRLRPDQANFEANLADVLVQTNKNAAAVDHYQAAVQLQPDFAATYEKLAKALAAVDRSKEAVETAQHGVEIARANGQETQADEIEEWLNHYKRELKRDNQRE